MKMKEIKIIARSEKGRTAIEQNVHDFLKEKKRVKMLGSLMGIKQEIINLDPLTVSLSINSRLYENIIDMTDWRVKIENSLSGQGCNDGEDFIIEVNEC